MLSGVVKGGLEDSQARAAITAEELWWSARVDMDEFGVVWLMIRGKPSVFAGCPIHAISLSFLFPLGFHT